VRHGSKEIYGGGPFEGGKRSEFDVGCAALPIRLQNAELRTVIETQPKRMPHGHRQQYIPSSGRLIPAPLLARDAMLWGSRRQNGERAS
jgi:hypothetical protein